MNVETLCAAVERSWARWSWSRPWIPSFRGCSPQRGDGVYACARSSVPGTCHWFPVRQAAATVLIPSCGIQPPVRAAIAFAIAAGAFPAAARLAACTRPETSSPAVRKVQPGLRFRAVPGLAVAGLADRDSREPSPRDPGLKNQVSLGAGSTHGGQTGRLASWPVQPLGCCCWPGMIEPGIAGMSYLPGTNGDTTYHAIALRMTS